MWRLLLLVMLSGCGTRETQKLTLASAANMRFVMSELVQVFSASTGIDCALVTGSSGKLMAQIKAGAPYDVFMSADMKYPTELFDLGLTTTQPSVYAYGKLVLWSMTDGFEPDINALTQGHIRHIAIANAEIAPYGRAAVTVLKNSNIYGLVEEKLIYGESISQTNQFIVSGAAEIGFTAMSVVLSEKMKGKGKWIPINERLYDKIEQGVVLINNESAFSEEARQFYDFLLSDQGQKVLNRYGYSTMGDQLSTFQ